MSPCVNICTLDDDYVCMGCLRTLEEITAWANLTGEQQWAVLAELEQRARRKPAGG